MQSTPEDLIVPLDSGGRHTLRFQIGPTPRVSLHHSEARRRSRLHQAFKQHLFLRGESCARIDFVASDAAKLPHDAKVDVFLQNLRLATIELKPKAQAIGERHILSPFETRYLAENGRPHPVSASMREAK